MNRFVAGCVLVAFAALSFWAVKQDGCDQDALYEAIKKDAALQLRSPISAVFSPMSESVTLSSDTKSLCNMVVNGYVDSQNGFGAMLRSQLSGSARDENGAITVTTFVER